MTCHHCDLEESPLVTHQPRIGTDAEWVADGFSRDETLVLALGPDALPTQEMDYIRRSGSRERMNKRRNKTSSSPSYGSASELILTAVGEALAMQGPGAVNVGEICSELGVSPSLVNYHFGSRERLMALAVVREAEKLVEDMATLTYAHWDSPEEQLIARIKFRMQWTQNHPGIDSMMNYSHIIDPVGEILHGELEARITAFTLADSIGLHTSVYGMYLGRALERPAHELGLDDVPELIDITGFLALGCIGLATWMTGQHPASRALGFERPETMLFLADSAIERLVRTVRTEVEEIRERRAGQYGKV